MSDTDLLQNLRSDGNAIIATVHGEIDLHNSPDLRGRLLRALDGKKPEKLVLNLGEVPYMDSSAIAVLVETMQRLRPHKGKIILTNLQPRVKSLLEIAKLHTIFGMVASEADALAK
ncbi:MAG: STAS domain-containing protein [Tepidisphaeraceae bacterium]